jgi:hypothetical protein
VVSAFVASFQYAYRSPQVRAPLASRRRRWNRSSVVSPVKWRRFCDLT